MIKEAKEIQLGKLYDALAAELDVPPAKYKEAEDHYKAVDNWLSATDSELSKFDVEIYPQGSFALGTAIRPMNEKDYDVDAVCCISATTSDYGQKGLKDAVGRRLKAHKVYRDLLDPKDGGRRCWTLKYADKSRFHVDILPAIPDSFAWLVEQGVPLHRAKHALRITDKKDFGKQMDWPRTNPKGYELWFKDSMRVRLEEAKQFYASEHKASVEDVPDYQVRTPLQRAIQILKRHRDAKYGDDEDSPISIIITTLATHSYNNESTLIDALTNMVPKMRNFIENREGVYWVKNPVNPKENFADKWNESPRKKDQFFGWLRALESDHASVFRKQGLNEIGKHLSECFGEREANGALGRIAKDQFQKRKDGGLFMEKGTGILGASAAGTPIKPHTFFGS